jgi:hypothetical protein
MVVCDDCNTNRKSYTRREGKERVYENDTAFKWFFTGAHEFTVKELEVFEIIKSHDRPATDCPVLLVRLQREFPRQDAVRIPQREEETP